MAGQLIKRGENTWLVRHEKRHADGTRKSYSKTFKGDKKDAQKVLNEMLRNSDLGLLGNSNRQTVNEFLDFWLSSIAKPRLQYRTYKDYTDLLVRYVRPSLGNTKLCDLKAIHIQQLYSEMQAKGLSARTVRYAHAVLSSSLRSAVELDILTRNVAKLVQLPKQLQKEMDVLSKEEAIDFLHALEGERYGTMFSFAIATGMRPEEYFGLQWKDIDFERGTATVQRAVVRFRKGGGWQFSQPKTSKSRRTIPLPTETVDQLRKHRKAQLEERMSMGSIWNDYDLVFTSEIGTPLNPPNVTRAFKKLLTKAKIRSSIRLYDLRHTTATLLLQAGVNPKVVSERLGHSTISLTLDVYSHVLPTMQEDATAQLQEMIFSKKATA